MISKIFFKKNKGIKNLTVKKKNNNNAKYANLFPYFNKKIIIYIKILYAFFLTFNNLFEFEFNFVRYI